ncbi:putative transporter [Cyphellophora attinorum]|uniref:Putative transporter n=1 Tax=Cyphellophora attinorum TaxID=1664694 RepID=A0A0N0NKE4_9EURO|nr:putative transporter [Phialophora attinorum]KPI37938.1 putative transporter [Phialophora attinorum]
MDKMNPEVFEKEEVRQDETPNSIEWTEEEERRMRWKLDLRIVPTVFFLFLLCYIDRTNIGNARIAGMQTDLNLTGYRFNWALSIFYFAYVFVEIPSNLVLKIVGGKIWIPTLVIGFGIVSLCTAFVKNYAGLLALRFFLGICEGGVLPGIAFYLSTFYRRKELLFRVSIMIMGSSLAGAFGGLLAAALTQIPDWGTSSAVIHTWRNIFFFEGLVSVLAAFLGLWILPNSPGSAKFLGERGRQIAAERMHREYKEADATEKVRARHVKQALLSVHGTLCAGMFFFLNIGLASFSVFLPTILRDLGYTAIQAQLRSVAPYVCACAMGIAIAYCSDRAGVRGPFIFGCACTSAIGYIILVASDSAVAKYAAVFLSAMGMFAAGPIIISWGLNNSAGPSVRSVTSAYIVATGNCAPPLPSGRIFHSWRQPIPWVTR